MKVVLVRHGESEANVADFINDDPRHIVNLTARGRAQAALAAQQLRSMVFTHAYASEFRRAQQTASIILSHHNCDLRVDPRLNERKSGMDGLPTRTFNDLVRPDPVNARPPRGESFLEQTQRVGEFLSSLAASAHAGVVLAVSHEHPIRSALVVAGLDPEDAVRQSIPNCGACVIEWHAGRWLRVPQLEEKYRPGERQRDGIGDDDRPAS